MIIRISHACPEGIIVVILLPCFFCKSETIESTSISICLRLLMVEQMSDEEWHFWELLPASDSLEVGAVKF